jgi:hypothetical protein
MTGATAFCLRHNDNHSPCEENRTRWSAQNAPIGNGVVSAVVLVPVRPANWSARPAQSGP